MKRTWLLVALASGCGGTKPAPAEAPAPATVENVAAPAPTPVIYGDSILWDEDDRGYMTALLRELRDTGERKGYPRLVEYVTKIEELITLVDRGAVTSKEQLLGLAAEAEDAMTDPVGDAISLQLDDVREVLRRAKRPIVK